MMPGMVMRPGPVMPRQAWIPYGEVAAVGFGTSSRACVGQWHSCLFS